MNKLISFVMAGRNDGYMGKFTWRIETAINLIAENFAKLNRLADLEIVVVDWGSDKPLHEELQLTHPAAEATRFILVPPEVAKEKQKDSPFSVAHALNVGIRRAQGMFIAQHEADCLQPIEFTQRLLDFLDKNQWRCHGLFFATRNQMHYEMAVTCPSREILDWLLAHAAKFMPDDFSFTVPRLGVCWPTSMMLMHRDIWDKCRGFDEKLIYMGWLDPDLALRVSQHYPFYWLKHLDFPELVHLEHYTSGQERLSGKVNPQIMNNPFTVNDDNWGAWNHCFNEFLSDGLLEYPKAMGGCY